MQRALTSPSSQFEVEVVQEVFMRGSRLFTWNHTRLGSLLGSEKDASAHTSVAMPNSRARILSVVSGRIVSLLTVLALSVWK